MSNLDMSPPSPRRSSPPANFISFERIPRDTSKPLAFRYFPRPALADLSPTEVFTPRRPAGLFQHPRYRHVDNATWLLLQVDGACSRNGQRELAKGGWGVVYGPRLEHSSGGVSGLLEGELQTSNRAELRACIAALRFRIWHGDGSKVVVIATDSEYVVLGMTERLEKWKRNGWKTSRGTSVANQDLWGKLERSIERCGGNCAIGFWLIPREWNSRADALAVAETGRPEPSPLEYGDVAGGMC